MNKLLIGICTTSLLIGCSSPAIKDTSLIQQEAMSMVQSGEQDVSAILNEARDLQVQAQQADLYFFSPKHMAQAEAEMAKAEQAFKQSKPDQEILTHSLTAKTLFQRGLKIKPTVENDLKPSFDALAMLKEINTHTVLKSDFEDLESDVKDLIYLIEDGKVSEANKDQADFLKDVTSVEIDTLKQSFLNPAENALEKAEDADAEEFAAKTYEIAEKAVEKLEKFIETQYKDRAAVAASSKETVQLAQHAEHVAKAAKPLLKIDAEQAEKHILYVESLLNKIKTAINHDAITHLSLDSQSIALAQAVEVLNKQAQTNQTNANWKQEKQTLEATIAELKKSIEDMKQAEENTATAPQEETSQAPLSEPSESQTEANIAVNEAAVTVQSNNETTNP